MNHTKPESFKTKRMCKKDLFQWRSMAVFNETGYACIAFSTGYIRLSILLSNGWSKVCRYVLRYVYQEFIG